MLKHRGQLLVNLAEQLANAACVNTAVAATMHAIQVQDTLPVYRAEVVSHCSPIQYPRTEMVIYTLKYTRSATPIQWPETSKALPTALRYDRLSLRGVPMKQSARVLTAAVKIGRA